MRRIQIVKKLFIKLSDFERARSHVLHCYESIALHRNETNDNLVPVTFPVNAVFPHKQKRLKHLVALLEVWWCSNEIFGMPKGGLDLRCLLVFALVLFVLEICMFCSLRDILFR